MSDVAEEFEDEGELASDVELHLPDAVWSLPYLERYLRSRSNPDFCTLDDSRYFIRCVLPVPFSYQEGFFGWGIWVEVAKADHDAYLAHYQHGSVEVAPLAGTVANNLPSFSPTLGLPVTVTLDDEHRPFVQIDPSSRHKLAREQKKGIDRARHEALAAEFS
ncbi:MAG: DUF2199 domain-containing protein [Burkholderiaceae bacterium]